MTSATRARAWLVVMATAFAFLGFASPAAAQLSGTLNIPGDYATLAAAIADLNAQGVGSGGVTLNLVSGNPESAPAGGYVIGGAGSLVLTTASAANPVTLQGNDNVITASGTLTPGALNDALFKLIGADWITITGFTLQENPLNTVTTAASNNMTEWGVALLYASTTDGAQNDTILGNTITLNRTYQNTFGIYSNVRHSTTSISVVADITAATGDNSNLHIYGNTISNVNIGIVVVGCNGSGLIGAGLDIGGTTVATGNTITNYGTTGTFSGYAGVSGTVNGVYTANQLGPNVSYNTITSSPGGVTAGTLRGIFLANSSTPTLPTVGSYTHNVSNNNIALRTGLASGTMEGIRNDLGNATVSLFVNNNNFSDFTNTGASPSGTIIFIINTAATLSQTINTNTFTNMTVPTTGSVTFLSNSVSAPAGGFKTVNGNSIMTAFSKTGAGGTVTLYTDGASSVAGVIVNNNNNNFSNITVAGATTVAGWSNIDGGSPTKTFQGNIFANWTGGTSSITAMNLNYGASVVATQNTISNITGGSSVTGIVVGSSLTAATVSQNTINGLSSTGAAAVQGITTATPTSNLLKNKIHDLSGSNAGSTVNGLLVSGGTTVTVANNLIGDLRAPAATATGDVVRGVSITSTTASSSINLAYNTIYLNAASSGANFSTTGIYHTTNATATTAALNMRDNAVVNLSTPSGTGVAAAYRRSSTALTNYASTSNNNLLYAGAPGAGHAIFFDGTNQDPTLAAYQARVTPRDANSVTENPPFLSTAGSSPSFLHVDPAVATQVESGGLPIAGITDDFDSQARNAATPDIGADEGTFTLGDSSGPTIAYSPLGNTGLTGDRTLVATITDASGVPGDGIGLPVLYWRVNAGAYVPATAISLGSNQYQFAFGAGAVAADVVTYYLVAQDNAGTPNISVHPAAGAAGPTANPPAVATPPTTPNAYTIVPPISGTLAVGAGGSYPTLTAAIADLNSKFVAGPVTFELTDATYGPSETFPIVINENAGASAVNRVTIRPAAGQAPVISGSLASGALIKLNGADYVTIDGSNAGGSDRSLTITNTATTAPCAIWIASLGNGAGAAGNVVQNCNLNTSAGTTATAYGISVSGASIGTAGGDNDDVTLQNNAINSPNIGIYANGNAAVSAGGMDNLIVSGNAFAGASALSPMYGVQVANALNATVSQNTVNLTTSASTQPVGISLEANVSNSTVIGNRINGVVVTATGGYGARGITVGTGTTASNITVANNFVAGVNGSNYSSFSNSSSMGIGIGVVGNGSLTATTGGVKLYHNSVNMAGNYSYAAACLTAGLYVGSGASALDIRNNIIVNTLNNTNATGTGSKAYAVYSAAASAAYAPISYNDYYVSGTQGVLGYLGGDQTTLGAFNTAFTGSAGTPALNVAAPFTSATDLHLPAAATSLLESGGVSGTGIAVDIDDQTRPGPAGSVNGGATAPDLGADEFDGTPVVANDLAATAFVDPTNGGTKSLGVAFAPQASFTNLGTAAQTDVTVRYRIVGPAPSGTEVYNETASIASLASMAITTVTFPSATLTAGGSYTIYAAAELAGDGTPGNDQITGSVNVLTPLSGTYLVGLGTYKDLAGADVTFAREVRRVTREVLEPVEPSGGDKSLAPQQLEWTVVTREVEEEIWVPLVNGQKFEQPLRVSREENPALPAWSRDGAYATITAAVADLNARGVDGPVQFLLTDASYPTETLPITINVTSGAPTATNTVTIKPNTGVTTTVAGASAGNAVFKVLNTGYITIDGANAEGGTTRNLTLENTSATSPLVVWFGSSGTTPITDGSLKNCVVRNGAVSSSAVVISDGAVAGNAGYFADMEVRNNRIEKAYIGIYANGGTTVANGAGLTCVGNELNASGANSLRHFGIYAQGVNGGVVAGNDIGNLETATNENDFGIWLATGATNIAVNANRVHDIGYSGTSGYGGKGITLSTGVPAAGVTVSNNMIFNITGDGDSYTSYGCTYAPTGIFAYGTPAQGGLDILDNSIFLYGNTINYTAAAYSVGIGLDDGSAGNVSGNNVVNNLGRLAAVGTGATAIALETSAAQLTAGDYNNLYSNATGSGTNLVGKIGTTDYATLAAWQAASGRDAGSITAYPEYVGNTDLHVRTDVLSPVSNAGAPFATVANDYDGDLRTATPDIGADEFTAYTLATAVVGGGTIVVSPAQTAYAPGTVVTLTAVPADGCEMFTGWSGDAAGVENPVVVVMDGDRTVTATFAPRTVVIAATAGPGGAIDPAGAVPVNCGTDQTFTITPAGCFVIADVLVDGVSVGAVASYTFTDAQANHTIEASFLQTVYTITAAAGPGGSIDPSGAVNVACGTDQTFVITPAANFQIATVLVDGVPVGAVASYTFTGVSAHHTIAATFVPSVFAITATAGAGGSIDPSGVVNVNGGDDATFTVTAASCFQIADVLVDGVSVGAVPSYTFTDVQANHTIAASFTQTIYTITASAGPGGSIDPSGAVPVICGADRTFAILPDANFQIVEVLVDGVPMGPVASYTFTDVSAHHTIAATFAATAFTITATAGTGGSIAPSGVVGVGGGDDATFTITPDACFHVADVLVDGISVGPVADYTFTDVQANHTIAASFVQATYTIIATAGTGGTITPVGEVSVNCGEDRTFTIAPASCSQIADVLVDGTSVGAVTSYTFTGVQANHTIEASFAQTTYTITAVAGQGGAINPGGAVAVGCGEDQTFTIEAASCYGIADVRVDGVSVGAVANYTFTGVAADHTIEASFAPTTYTITASADAGGTISPAGPVVVVCGADQVFAITANAGYGIVDVTVDGTSVGPVATYTFTDVVADHAIHATFTDSQGPAVEVLAPNGGETLYVGVDVDLRWLAADNIEVTTVDLLLSRDGLDGPFETIASGLPNSGSYSWLVSVPVTDTAAFKAVAHDAAGNAGEDVSDAVFTITDAVAVMLAEFHADPVDDGVELRWAFGDAAAFDRTTTERSEAEAGPWTALDAQRREEGGEFVQVDATAEAGRTYWYRLTVVTRSGQTVSFEPASVVAGMPIMELSLPTVSPNPLRWPALVSFAVPRQTHVRVTVHDVRGRQVATLTDRNYDKGRYQVTWSGDGQGTRLVSGVYFVRLETPEKVLTRRVVNLH